MTTEQAMREALDGKFYGVDHLGTYYCKNVRLDFIPNHAPPNRGNRRRPWTAAEDVKLREFHAIGMWQYMIGKELNRSKADVCYRLAALGIEKRKPRPKSKW